MNIITNKCLQCLKEKKWKILNEILKTPDNQKELSLDPFFSIFEANLISEIKRYENEDNEDLLVIVTQISNVIEKKDSKLSLSNECQLQIVEYLFHKNPCEKYAKQLRGNKEAEKFLENQSSLREIEINKLKLSSNLDVKVTSSGQLKFSKSVFNSPQEKELYLSAKKILIDELVIPNLALSTIIDSKVLELFESDNRLKNFFFKSTLDLCIIDSISFIPQFYIELDSSWHDKPKQIEKDEMKDEIFRKAGLKLYRLRKLENKNMEEIFKIFIQTVLKNGN